MNRIIADVNRFRKCRENKGMSQKTVAVLLNVAAPSVNNWESGKTSPSHNHLQKLADIYDVTVDYLLGRDATVSDDNGKPGVFLSLRSLRIDNGFSQKDVAHALGVAQTTYCQWENGKREPDYKTLCRIADFFGVSIDSLFGRNSSCSIDERKTPPFCQQLRDLRMQAGLTQIELSVLLGFSKGAIGNWETGLREPDYTTLQRIADFFGITLDFLLGRDVFITDEKVSFMNRIKELRKEKGLSQAELAKTLFVNQTAVSQWERGATMPSPNMLNTLADYFHVTTDYLLGRDEAAAADAGQKEKPVENDGPEANGGLNMDALTPDERAILDLLRQVPDEDLPAAHRAIKALLAGMRDGE